MILYIQILSNQIDVLHISNSLNDNCYTKIVGTTEIYEKKKFFPITSQRGTNLKMCH